MKKIAAALPWVGSKRQLRDEILKRIPEHTCYVEPFAGAAWVFLGKEPSKVEVINDVNGDLIALYRVLKDHREEFEEQLWFMFPSRALYAESKAILERNRESQILTDVERAVLFYYHIKNAFGGRYGSGFGFSKSRPPRGLLLHDLFVSLQERLQRTYVENLSFERVIKNYDSPATFFYCDPPYRVSDDDAHYQFVFDEAQHALLKDKLASAQGKWLLSYDDCEFIRELYRGFKIHKTKPVTYSLSGKPKQKTELLISNF
jgi:DNA adenine methylase